MVNDAAKKRIVALDAARGVAVMLAMLSHSFVQFGPHNPVSPLTRLATPTFVVLLGAMLAVVYMRRIRGGMSPSEVRRRLAERSILCYVLFALITVAGFATGKMEAPEMLQALTYMSNGRFGTILKLYAVLFLIVVAILPLASRYGGSALAAVALIGWAMKVALDATGVPDLYFLDFLFGYAEGGFGPSIFPGFVFVAFGFWIGEMMSGNRSRVLPGLIVAMAALCLWITMNGVSYSEIENLVSWTKRSGDHPDYYVFGILGSALTIWVCSVLVRIPALLNGLGFLGQQTLFVYGFGNILLTSLPVYRGDDALVSAGLIAAFLLALVGLSVERLREGSLIGRVLGTLPARIMAAYTGAVDGALGRLFPPDVRSGTRAASSSR